MSFRDDREEDDIKCKI